MQTLTRGFNEPCGKHPGLSTSTVLVVGGRLRRCGPQSGMDRLNRSVLQLLERLTTQGCCAGIGVEHLAINTSKYQSIAHTAHNGEKGLLFFAQPHIALFVEHRMFPGQRGIICKGHEQIHFVVAEWLWLSAMHDEHDLTA